MVPGLSQCGAVAQRDRRGRSTAFCRGIAVRRRLRELPHAGFVFGAAVWMSLAPGVHQFLHRLHWDVDVSQT